MDPSFWANVTAFRPGLRINFGHFGNTDILADGDRNAQRLMSLMTQGAGSPGELLFADSAFLAEILSNQGGMQGELAKLLAVPPAAGGAPLRQRLMYGTDWEMVVIEGNLTQGYLDDFQAVFDQLAQRSDLNPQHDLVDRFFGRNAVEYLGLRAGKRTRQRLDEFHRGRPQPGWMAKVDALPPLA
jgi:hypothetical protein